MSVYLLPGYGIVQETDDDVHLLVGYGVINETVVADSTVYGFVPGKARKKRKYLVTINGERHYVDEEGLDEWLAVQEREIVEEATTPVVKKGRVTLKKPQKVPKLKAPSGDAFILGVISDANARIARAVADYRASLEAEFRLRKAIEDDDEEVLLLLL